MQRPGKSLNRSDNIESFYCCTNFDKSTLFKKVLKADIDKKWCGSARKTVPWLYNSITRKMFIYVNEGMHRK